LTISPPAALLGVQRPRILSVPPTSSCLAGQEAVELATLAGLELDPWQAFVLEKSLAERPGGKWAAFEVGLVVPRQNGKGSILEARELAGLFLLGERLILHSAHRFDTALEACRRIMTLIESTPDLDRRVKRVTRSHGEEGIELRTGQRLRFKARTSSGGRGFSGDTVILDEAMILPVAAMGALMPTMSARPNPQLWYVGSAVNAEEHEHGTVLTRIRQRGLKGNDPSLAYLEWSAPEDADHGDIYAWAQANPGLGIRIQAEHVARERASMVPKTFGVERLGIGDWPDEDGGNPKIDPTVWAELADPSSRRSGPVAFAIDVAPDMTSAAVAVAGRRADGLAHVEIAEDRPGTEWVVERVAAMCAKTRPCAVAVDARSPAAALAPRLREKGVVVTLTGVNEMGQACGGLQDLVTNRQIRHLHWPPLDAAVASARPRAIGEAGLWGWKRGTPAPITTLVAATLAVWAHAVYGTASTSTYEDRGFIVL
jgi:hypothetical protein